MYAIRSYYDPSRATYPVLGLTHDQAERYCQWCGRRLPTEAAARAWLVDLKAMPELALFRSTLDAVEFERDGS